MVGLPPVNKPIGPAQSGNGPGGRKKTKAVWLGKVKIGDNAPVTVQSMTKTNTGDVIATVNQIKELESLGCEIIRVAVPNHMPPRQSRI